jgi:decaprenylphospho-beta-D-erythro-pentofuranosid-2-ulose 2-reductase
MTIPWKHALVIGASSGIGEALAWELGRRGVSTALVARRGNELRRVSDGMESAYSGVRAPVFIHDVRDTGAVDDLFQRIALELGGLDLVIYVAGIMPKIGPREYRTEADLGMIETNLSGAVAWLNAAARRFGVQRGGTIVGISSIAGERGRRGLPIYCATKAALNSYLDSLRARLATSGVTVLTVKPGYVRTPQIGEGRTPLPAISAQQAASEILAAAASGKRRVFVPGWWRVIAFILRAIPDPIFERLPLP